MMCQDSAAFPLTKIVCCANFHCVRATLHFHILCSHRQQVLTPRSSRQLCSIFDVKQKGHRCLASFTQIVCSSRCAIYRNTRTTLVMSHCLAFQSRCAARPTKQRHACRTIHIILPTHCLYRLDDRCPAGFPSHRTGPNWAL